MVSDTFLNVLLFSMVVIMVFGTIWGRNFDKETKRMKKENEDQEALNEKSAQI